VDRGRKIALLASASLGTLGAFTPGVASPYVALALASIACFAQLSWSSNIHTSISEIAPPEHVAVLYGITGAAGNGLGALFQPVIGRMVDTLGYGPAFVASGLTYIVAMACVYAAGRIEPIERRSIDGS
jgi:ACS family hexuronate transporter-like MFS transporter